MPKTPITPGSHAVDADVVESNLARQMMCPPPLVGWSCLEYSRRGGSQAGRKYHIFVSPDQKRFRSSKEVKKFTEGSLDLTDFDWKFMYHNAKQVDPRSDVPVVSSSQDMLQNGSQNGKRCRPSEDPEHQRQCRSKKTSRRKSFPVEACCGVSRDTSVMPDYSPDPSIGTTSQSSHPGRNGSGQPRKRKRSLVSLSPVAPESPPLSRSGSVVSGIPSSSGRTASGSKTVHAGRSSTRSGRFFGKFKSSTDSGCGSNSVPARDCSNTYTDYERTHQLLPGPQVSVWNSSSGGLDVALLDNQTDHNSSSLGTDRVLQDGTIMMPLQEKDSGAQSTFPCGQPDVDTVHCTPVISEIGSPLTQAYASKFFPSRSGEVSVKDGIFSVRDHLGESHLDPAMSEILADDCARSPPSRLETGTFSSPCGCQPPNSKVRPDHGLTGTTVSHPQGPIKPAVFSSTRSPGSPSHQSLVFEDWGERSRSPTDVSKLDMGDSLSGRYGRELEVGQLDAGSCLVPSNMTKASSELPEESAPDLSTCMTCTAAGKEGSCGSGSSDSDPKTWRMSLQDTASLCCPFPEVETNNGGASDSIFLIAGSDNLSYYSTNVSVLTIASDTDQLSHDVFDRGPVTSSNGECTKVSVAVTSNTSRSSLAISLSVNRTSDESITTGSSSVSCHPSLFQNMEVENSLDPSRTCIHAAAELFEGAVAGVPAAGHSGDSDRDSKATREGTAEVSQGPGKWPVQTITVEALRGSRRVHPHADDASSSDSDSDQEGGVESWRPLTKIPHSHGLHQTHVHSSFQNACGLGSVDSETNDYMPDREDWDPSMSSGYAPDSLTRLPNDSKQEGHASGDRSHSPIHILKDGIGSVSAETLLVERLLNRLDHWKQESDK